MATYSSVLAWRIPGTESLVGCRLWGHTESDTTEETQQQQLQSHLDEKNRMNLLANPVPQFLKMGFYLKVDVFQKNVIFSSSNKMEALSIS